MLIPRQSKVTTCMPRPLKRSVVLFFCCFVFFLLRLIWQHYCYRSSNQPPLWLFWNYFRGNNILKSCGTVGIWLMSVISFWLLIKTAPMNWFIIIHPAYSILNTDDYLYLVLRELLLTHYLKVCLFVFCKIWD